MKASASGHTWTAPSPARRAGSRRCSIDTLDQSDQGVDVTFHGGGRRTFDMVFGADGLHSHTRALLSGPEEQFHRHLGYCSARFTMRSTFGLAHEIMMWNTPGRAAALYAVGDGDEVHAFLNLAHPEPPIAAMRDADQLFVDVVSQIRAQRDAV